MSKSNLHVIVGLGATGLSCLRYLRSQNIPVAMTDSRLDPPGLALVRQENPELRVELAGLSEALLAEAALIVCSPGVALSTPLLKKALLRGVPIVGDIELFALAAKAPIIAITGSNAKSTVTTLVGLMASEAGLRVQVGGNLGIPALDLLATPEAPELYVLELSSFQLETTYSLKAQVATVLNISPDHMDRYRDVAEYAEAKQRIYQGCQVAVCNRDDAATDCGERYLSRRFYFTLQEPVQNEFGLLTKDKITYLAFEDELLMPVSELPVRGRHYQANALAALAIGYGFGLPMVAMLAVLRRFMGLQHRCQLVREWKGVSWYNDSKGTNVGATQAAMEGIGSEIKGKLIWIAGGVGKGADFSVLAPLAQKYVRTSILIGEAAPILAATLGSTSEVIVETSLEAAIHRAEQKAHPGDSVLLSPACASFDMFRNYEHRGEVFMQVVEGLS